MPNFNIKKSLFFQSFKKIDKDFLYIVVYDIIFYLVLALIIFLAFNTLISVLNVLQEVLPFLTGLQANLDGSNPQLEQELDTSLSLLKAVMIKAVAIFSVAAAIIYLISTYLKGMIWSKVLEIKFDWLFYRKFLFLRLVWYLMWAVVFSLIIFNADKEAMAGYFIILGTLFLYFTMILLCLFRKEKKILRTIKQTFGLGIKRFYLLLLPYILSFLLSGITYSVISLFSTLGALFLILSFIVTILFLAWLRLYIYSVVKHIENKKSFIL